MPKRYFKAVYRTAVILACFLLSTPTSSFVLQVAALTSPSDTAQMMRGGPLSNRQTQLRVKQIPASPPPMGWSSWNSFSNTVDSNVITQQAKALVATGMKKMGYQYINIDEGWWLGHRDQDGNIVVDAKQWPALQPGERPGDMSNIVGFIHGVGLKAGIYTDAGEAGCSLWTRSRPSRAAYGQPGILRPGFLAVCQMGVRLRQGRLVRWI